MIEITEKNYNEVMNNRDEKFLILKFYTDTCVPCKKITPILQDIEDEREDVLIGNVNIGNEDTYNIWSLWHIRSVPTLLIFNKDELKSQFYSYVNKQSIEEELK